MAPAVRYHSAMGTVIDIHAHYVPAELISLARSTGAQLGIRLIEDAATPALHFDGGISSISEL
ncbi:MAG: hypothetical protein JO328_20990 [Hyphomicrobiales bacterium]|nr:hypothetical protein [Hyphomicrobiales bacterium]MBV8826716.1 hypothetical protein [Hyphomicrobiales bacterium]